MAELVADPVLHGIWTVGGSAGLERVVEDVDWYDGELGAVAGHLVVCDESHVTPAYRLDALVRRARDADAAAVLVVAGPQRPLLSSIRLADRLEIPVLWLEKRDPVRLVQELTARIRAPEQVRARTVERLLQALRIELLQHCVEGRAHPGQHRHLVVAHIVERIVERIDGAEICRVALDQQVVQRVLDVGRELQRVVFRRPQRRHVEPELALELAAGPQDVHQSFDNDTKDPAEVARELG